MAAYSVDSENGWYRQRKTNEDMTVVDSKSKTLLLYILWFWKQHIF